MGESANGSQDVKRQVAGEIGIHVGGKVEEPGFETVKSDRASMMVYVVRGERDDEAWYIEHDDEAWYIEHTYKNENGVISKLVGVDRDRLQSFVGAESRPAAGSLARRLATWKGRRVS